MAAGCKIALAIAATDARSKPRPERGMPLEAQMFGGKEQDWERLVGRL